MKITDLKTYLVTHPPEGANQVTWLFVRIDTDEGIYGWGESGGSAPGVAVSVREGIHSLKDDIIGENPADIERIWHKVYRRFSYFGSRGFGTNVAAGGSSVHTFAFLEPLDSALSPDKSMQKGLLLPLDLDANNLGADSGYTGWVEYERGKFVAANYINDDAPMAQIRGYRFSLDDF